MFCRFSDAFDYDFGMGILRMPSRMYQEHADVVIDLDEVAHNGIQLGTYWALINLFLLWSLHLEFYAIKSFVETFSKFACQHLYPCNNVLDTLFIIRRKSKHCFQAV